MDPESVIRAQRGDQAAFAQIASETYGRLHSLAFGILRDGALAEDATQQAMLDIWRNLPKLRDPARFEAWAYRLAVNVCYTESRRAKRWMPRMLDETMAEPAAADEIDSVADRELLDRGFRELPVDQRAVLVLRHLAGMPMLEVARVLDIPPGTARSRLHRGLRTMRATIDAETRSRDGAFMADASRLDRATGRSTP